MDNPNVTNFSIIESISIFEGSEDDLEDLDEQEDKDLTKDGVFDEEDDEDFTKDEVFDEDVADEDDGDNDFDGDFEDGLEESLEDLFFGGGCITFKFCKLFGGGGVDTDWELNEDLSKSKLNCKSIERIEEGDEGGEGDDDDGEGKFGELLLVEISSIE